MVYVIAEEREIVLMRLGDDRHLGYSDPDVMIGTRVGPFTIVRLVGERGMGKVYVVEHNVLKTQRAVKLLSPQLTENALLVRRFVNEARVVAKLQHRNLIQVHDVGQLPSGAWFMVLDYLDGDTLGGYMTTHVGPIPERTIVHVVREIANGLQVAHEHKILHRDLKPENVFLLARDGELHHAVVLDFGVTQLGDDPATRNGIASGPVVYMSPEQLRGTKMSPAADVFSLGVIAYEMSTGGWFPHQQHDELRASYCELAATELYHRQMTHSPVDPRDRCPGLSGAWASAILAALNPDPAERPASARALALCLAETVSLAEQVPHGLGLAIVRTGAHDPHDPVSASDASGRAGSEDGALRLSSGAGSRYQIGDKLGTGGMAEVFAGTMIGLEGFARRVAIKRVLAGLSQVPAFGTMFVAEAQIASQLVHPNIVSVFDFSRDLEGRLFLVMEYVDGKDLASLLHAGPISPSLAIFIVIEMLRGLGYAHDLPDLATGTRGVIHRDVSPQNLLLSYEGAVKVSDFGLAKARAASQGVWSETVRGKPSYMSPEQVSGEMLDGRTDLYAVGVMLWEMLAHRSLFTGTSKEIMAQVMFKDIAAPSGIRGGVPADLEAIAMKLLSRDRSDRYLTAEAAIEALLACGDVPRDGRGELMELLTTRFPRAGASSQRKSSGAVAGAPHTLRVERVTVADPSSVVVRPAPSLVESIHVVWPPRRWLFAAALSVVVGGSLAAVVVLARGGGPQAGQVAPQGISAPERVVPTLSAVAPTPTPPPQATTIAPSAGGMPVDAGVADAVRSPEAVPAPRSGGSTTSGPLSLPAAGTGELAIIVKPWAMIWLNGRRSGQTPFREAVPSGRYLVRLANDDVGQDETTTITVESGGTATVERNW